MNMNPARAVSNLTRHTLALGLTSLLFVHPALALREPMPEAVAPELPGPEVPGKSPATLPEAPYPEAEGLTIEILDGEGALNNIRQRTAREPIVEVEDKNHKPVAGALVLFSINTGPGGAGGSVGGLSTLSVRTGVDGKAQLHGLTPNNVSGEFTISVSASIGTLVATAVIHQKNDTLTGETNNTSTSQPAQNPVSTVGKIITHHHNYLVQGSIVGGAVVAGAIVAVVVTRKTGGATITAGNGTVSAP